MPPAPAEARATSANPLEQLLRGINRGVALAAERVGEVAAGLLLLLLAAADVATWATCSTLPLRSTSAAPRPLSAAAPAVTCCLMLSSPLPSAYPPSAGLLPHWQLPARPGEEPGPGPVSTAERGWLMGSLPWLGSHPLGALVGWPAALQSAARGRPYLLRCLCAPPYLLQGGHGGWRRRHLTPPVGRPAHPADGDGCDAGCLRGGRGGADPPRGPRPHGSGMRASEG